ncbi:MAG: hypothetical protein O7C62_08775 [Rickettsia endosymbiont of Ixodes persulcatus]|nr:hypothetical protein [Rickettsia endosymbiont of Ixodes persulcatus]
MMEAAFEPFVAGSVAFKNISMEPPLTLLEQMQMKKKKELSSPPYAKN